MIPTVWSAEVLRATENALVMAPLVVRYDSLVKSKGDTLKIPNLSNLTAYSKSASTEVTLNTVTETETTLNITSHYHAAFLVEDILKVQSSFDLMSGYTSKAGEAVARQVDSDLLGLYSSSTNTDVGTYGVDITDPVILAAAEALDLANAPLDNRNLVIYPTQKTALLKIDKFVKADYMGEYNDPTIVRTGPNSRYMWGDIYGVPVYYTKQVTTTAGTPTQYHNIMFHKEGIALAMQQAPRTQSAYYLNYLGNLVVVDVIYGYTALRTDHLIEVRS